MNHSHAPAIINELYTSLCSLFYPGVKLVTFARGFALLARGLYFTRIHDELEKFKFSREFSANLSIIILISSNFSIQCSRESILNLYKKAFISSYSQTRIYNQ